MTDQNDILADRREATAGLGAALRSVIVAQCSTEVPTENLRTATELAARIEALLVGDVRPLGEPASVDDSATSIRYFGPVIGLGNPMSPPLVYHSIEDGEVRAHATLDRRFEGPRGFVHGGIIALLLDEVLGYTAAQSGRAGMTAYLNVTYSRPVPLDTELVVSAKIRSFEGRKTFVHGGIALVSNPSALNAEAEALFVQRKPH